MKLMRKIVKLFVPTGMMHRWLKRKYNIDITIPGDTAVQRALMCIAPYAVSAIMQQRKPTDIRPVKYFLPYGKMREHVYGMYGMKVGDAKREAGLIGKIRSIMPYGLILWWDAEDAEFGKEVAANNKKPTPANPTVSVAAPTELEALARQVEAFRKENDFNGDTCEIIALRSALGGKRPSVSVVLTGGDSADEVRQSLAEHSNNSIYEMELLIAYPIADADIAEVVAEFAHYDARIKTLDTTGKTLAAIRAEAISVAKGDYISFLNVNDRYANHQVLELFVLTAAAEKAWMCCGKVWANVGGEVIYPDNISWDCRGFAPSLHPPVPAGLSGAIVDRAWLKNTGLDPVRSTRSDDDLFMQAVEVLAERIFCLGRVVSVKGGDFICHAHTAVEREAETIDALLVLAKYAVTHDCVPLKSFLTEEISQRRAAELRNLLWGVNAANFKPKIIDIGKLLPECDIDVNFVRPLVSVVVPAYNVEKYLKRCIDSLVSQTLRSIEIIVVDDGSADDTPAIADSFAALHKNVQVIHKPNGGLSSARNAGMAVATGKYIGFVDSDDYVDSTMFAELALALEQHQSCAFTKCGIALEYVCKITESERRSSQVYFKDSLSGEIALEAANVATMDVCAVDKLYRAAFLRQNKILFPEGIENEDEAFYFEVCVRAGKAFVLNRNYYHYVRGENGIMARQLVASAKNQLPNSVVVFNFIAQLLKRENRCDLLGVLYRHMIGMVQRFKETPVGSDIMAAVAKILHETNAYYYADLTPVSDREFVIRQIYELLNRQVAGSDLPKVSVEWFPLSIPSAVTRWQTPLVSFVVPVYNAERYIAGTLESLRRQTLGDFEVVCIDDGSTDDSGVILDRYAEIDPRIRVWHLDNGGVSAARNYGLSQARGKYVAFVDGDDMLDVTMASRTVLCAEKYGLECVMFDYTCFQYDSLKPVEHYWKLSDHITSFPQDRVFAPGELPSLCIYGSCWNYLWQREFLMRVGVKFPKITLGEDLVWTLTTLSHVRRMRIINQELYLYRRGNPSSAVSRLQSDGNSAPVDALRELAKVIDASATPMMRKILLQRMIADILFYGEKFSPARSWLVNGGFDAFGGVDAILSVCDGGARQRLLKLKESATRDDAIGMADVISKTPPRIQQLMRKAIADREGVKKDLFIVVGQLNSTTNEPIDSWTFFRWLQDNGVPSRYVVWRKHCMLEKMRADNGLKDVIQLSGNGVDDCEFIAKCAELLPRLKAVVMENTALNPWVWRYFHLLDGCEYVFLQHGPTFMKMSSKNASAFAVVNYVNVSSDIERRLLESCVPEHFQTKRRPGYILAGLPRWDKLEDESDQETEKVVFFMPTWRATFNAGMSAIGKSAYLSGIKALVNSASVARLSKRRLKFVMAAHHHLTNHVADLDFGLPIELVPSSQISYWIRHASMCVTDYSSVCFDFLFLNKPCVFWIPDRHDGLLDDGDYSEVVFAQNQIRQLFNLAGSAEDVLQMIERYADRGFRLESAKRAIADRFFAFRHGICKRLYEQIMAIGDETQS